MSMLSNILDRLPPKLVNRVLRWIRFIPAARRLLSAYIINLNADAAPARPHPFSLQADGYTSWETLTDRSFTSRHLPSSSKTYQAKLPKPEVVVEMMMRDGAGQELAYDTSLLFPFFAQWFTDSFLRTHPSKFRENQSNHAIDLIQIYGMNAKQTSALRAPDGGRLKSQMIDGEEYGASLFKKAPDGAEPSEPGEDENWVMNGAVMLEEFQGLFSSENFKRAFAPKFPEPCPPELKEKIKASHHKHLMRCFAVGLEHGNSTLGNTLMNTIFLREHNRLARLLHAKYSDEWDDDRIFETARNINIVTILKIVVQDYVPHIAQFDFPLMVVPGVAEEKNWYRTNWISVEFNLLYRWHGLIPDTFILDSKKRSSRSMVNANELFLDTGADQIVRDMTQQQAGRIGLGHTPEFLKDVKVRTVALSRDANLRSYNEYRKHFGLDPLISLEELTKDKATIKMLTEHYTSIDNVEYLVGLLAESYDDSRMMGELQERMVAHDAFTHALTNPLLSERVYNAATFSKEGLAEIDRTNCLADVIVRNTKDLKNSEVSFDFQAPPVEVVDAELETVGKGEADASFKCLDAVTAAMRKEYPAGTKVVRRDAHPKHHGIVRATLKVEGNLPAELAHGIFAHPNKEYKAWVRFSNGSPTAAADINKDGRGMAIKVFGVSGERASEAPGLHSAVQDFIMIDHPVFFIRNPEQYAPFIRLQTAGKQGRFFFWWNPCKWHIRQALIARKIQKSLASPLENDYHSMSAYKLGPHAAKFSLRYQGERSAKIPTAPRDNYLRDAMVTHLADKEARFDFMIQRQTNARKMPVEDPTRKWSESASPPQRVAVLTIPKQVFDSDDQLKFAENISYNPWHSLMAHAPLGGLNRLRRSVYMAVSKLRHTRNKEPIPEPTGDETFQ